MASETSSAPTRTDTQARTLLTAALDDAHDNAGRERAVTELIGLCKGFPLALGLIAARIRTEVASTTTILSGHIRRT